MYNLQLVSPDIGRRVCFSQTLCMSVQDALVTVTEQHSVRPQAGASILDCSLAVRVSRRVTPQ